MNGITNGELPVKEKGLKVNRCKNIGKRSEFKYDRYRENGKGKQMKGILDAEIPVKREKWSNAS